MCLPELIAWSHAYLFCQLIEVPIYLHVLRRRWAPRRGPARRLLIALGASTLTHPLVWFVFPVLLPDTYWLMALSAETFAVATEAF